MLVFGLTSANQPSKLLRLWPARSLYLSWELDVRCWTLGISKLLCWPRYALYRRRFLCRCAFMRLRRLCLAIFALRLFLREPIQIFQICEFRFNHQMRYNATRFSHCSVTSLL